MNQPYYGFESLWWPLGTEGWDGVYAGVALRSGDVASIAAPIPEPSTYALMLAGLLGVALYTRRQRVVKAS